MKQPVESLIATYFKARPEVAAVYLFGSYAVQKERPFSDLDVAILVDDETRNFEELRAMCHSGLARMTRRDIDLVIMNTAGEELLKQIYTQGKCILVNNREQLTLFKMISYSRIADFGYHHEMMKKRFVQSITRGASRG